MSVTEVGNSSQIVQLTGLRKKESPKDSGRSWQFFTNCSINWVEEKGISKGLWQKLGNSSQIVQSTVLRKKESPQSFAHASQAPKESSTLGSSRCAGCK
jgi:hypothetical protein